MFHSALPGESPRALENKPTNVVELSLEDTQEDQGAMAIIGLQCLFEYEKKFRANLEKKIY